MAKGLYGQLQGDEHRGGMAQFNERLSDNEIVEGEAVAILHARFEERDWKTITSYTQELKNAGYSQARIDSMIVRAGCGVKL